MIRIIVGPQRELFKVHKSILLKEMPTALGKESTFFEGCLKHDFKETRQNEITLADVMPEVFLLVVRWLYSDNMWDLGEPQPFERQQLYILFAAYILSDRLGIERLQNTIMDELHRIQQFEGYIVDLKDEALDSDDLPELLEDYLLDSLVFQLEHCFNQKEVAKIAEEVLEAGGRRAVRIFQKIRRGADATSPECGPACKYHQHDRTWPAYCPERDW